ncbi:MAG: RDD family protein [Candidatus Marinimicrobia bacterium]|nr:RDD family protein [Candidatus Neomarinimicrobiota bacterium]
MDNDLKYVGFWKRTVAVLVDTFLIILVTLPILIWVYGIEYLNNEHMEKGSFDFIINYVFPTIAVILLWKYYQATPGKMIFKATIVDAKTGGKPTLKQWIIRYLGYFVSLLPFGLGYFWVAFDKKKQSFHDKLANTLVIQSKVIESESVKIDAE